MSRELANLDQYQRRSLPTLRDLAAVLFRQRWVAVLAAACVVVVLLVSGFWKQRYEAHMKILVLRQRMDAPVSAQPNAPAQLSPGITEEDLNSEVELIHSDDLLRSVVLVTGLGKHGCADCQPDEKGIAVAVRELNSNLDVEPIRKANVISIKYRTADPEMAVKVLNSIASAYIAKHKQLHRPSGEFAFFDQQTERYRRGLEQSEAELANFTRTNGVASAVVERDLALQRVAEFGASANEAQASVAEAEQRIQMIQRQLGAMRPRLTTEIKTGVNPELMQQLKTTLLNLQLKRTELLTKFDPAYTLVKETDQQIQETRAAIIAAEQQPAKEETTNEDPTYVLLQGELAKAQDSLAGYKARAAATETVADNYRTKAARLELEGLEQDDLQRTEKLEADNYVLYLQKREEARINDALDRRGILNVAVAEQPIVPALPAQSPLRKAAMTLFLCVFIGWGSAAVADALHPGLRTPDEVAAVLGIPVLASLPRSTS